MEKNVIWIASFPKSGNTWTRFLLNALMHRKSTLESLESDAKISGACTAKGLLKEFMEEKGDLAQRLTTRGDALRKLAQSRDAGKKLVLKTHSALAEFQKKPQIPMDVTAAAMLVIRNPFDVLCSCMNHFGFTEEQAFNFMDKISSSIGETDKHFPVLCSSWDGYTKSWTGNAKFPILLLRYEDMKTSPFTAATRICRFFNIKANENEIIEAINATSFKNLQKLEDDKGFKEASEKGQRFFYKGEIGYFKDTLSEETIQKVVNRFGESMRKVGYDYVEGNLVIKPLKIVQKQTADLKA
jgi:hypothetical protein